MVAMDVVVLVEADHAGTWLRSGREAEGSTAIGVGRRPGVGAATTGTMATSAPTSKPIHGAGEVLENLKSREAVKGEITLLIGKAESDARVETDAFVRLSVRRRVEQIMAEEKVDEKAALKKAAKERGVSKSEAYRELQRSR